MPHYFRRGFLSEIDREFLAKYALHQIQPSLHYWLLRGDLESIEVESFKQIFRVYRLVIKALSNASDDNLEEAKRNKSTLSSIESTLILAYRLCPSVWTDKAGQNAELSSIVARGDAITSEKEPKSLSATSGQTEN
ncbi:hypothetical protein Ciccas_005183 [Cichlidogyrus casuarinus]|uniref:Uncharacterized protein n=1 Tax=Cichlidogyrus casuarinus TaxID=1844966 RepID=A0ABD2Q9L6_9PLAT